MRLISLTKPTEIQRQQMLQLIKQVHQNDHTFRTPYLDNTFNALASMPAIFLAYDGGILIGLLTIYADEPAGSDAEISIVVAPAFRGQGVAKKLWQTAKLVLQQAGYWSYQFLTEQSFLNLNKTLLKHWSLTPTSETDNLMRAVTLNSPLILQKDVHVELLKISEIELLLPLYMHAFEITNPLIAKQYLLANLTRTNNDGYVFFFKDEIIGYCGVEYGTSNFLFGLFLDSKFRGLHLSESCIYKMCQNINKKYLGPFDLYVEDGNQIAKQAYEKVGFRLLTRLLYLM